MFIEIYDDTLVNFDAISNIDYDKGLNRTVVYLAGQLHPAMQIPGKETYTTIKQLLQLRGKFVSIPGIIARQDNFNKLMTYHFEETGGSDIEQLIDKADEVIAKAKASKAQLEQLSLFDTGVDTTNLN